MPNVPDEISKSLSDSFAPEVHPENIKALINIPTITNFKTITFLCL